MIANETTKLIIAVLICCAIIFGVQTVMDWKEGSEQNKQRGRTIEATSGIVKDNAKSEAQRVVIDVGVLENRTKFNQQLEEDKRREPEIAARAIRAIPNSRLRAFHERRLARERLGCIGANCQSESTTTPASERGGVLR